MRRSLSLFDVLCIGLNCIVGSGIFLLPDDLYREMGVLSPLAFVFCAILLLPIALCYAEAASRVDKSGGPYIYASEAFGGWVGFSVGWMCFANSVFSFAAVASAAGSYFGKLFPIFADPVAVKMIAALVIALFAALNYRGTRPGAVAVDLFTLGKFAVLLILVLSLVPEMTTTHVQASMPSASGIGAATFLAFFAAQGFEVAPVPAGETRSPERAMPIAVVGSLLLASLLYVLVQTTLSLAYADLSTVSDTPLADAALAVAPSLGLVVLAGGLISTLGFVSGSALGTPRYLYAAALDGHLPGALHAVHVRYETPHRAIVITALLSMALVIPFDYRSLIGMSIVSAAVQYLATCLAVLKLRSRGASPGFRAPGGPIVPLLGALASVWVCTEASGEELTWAAVSLVLGVLLVLAHRRLLQRAA